MVIRCDFISLLGVVIDSCHKKYCLKEHPWLEGSIQQWKINIEVSEFGLHLDEDWNSKEVDTVVSLFEEVNSIFNNSDTISLVFIEELNNQYDLRIDLRSHTSLLKEPLVLFGEALCSMLRGSFNTPVGEGWWFYGDDGKSFLPKLPS